MKRKIDLIAPYENHAVILLAFVCGRLRTLPEIIKCLPKMIVLSLLTNFSLERSNTFD